VVASEPQVTAVDALLEPMRYIEGQAWKTGTLKEDDVASQSMGLFYG
jgi:hypothetical protein